MERFNCKRHSCHVFMHYHGLRCVQCVCVPYVFMYVQWLCTLCYNMYRLFTVLHSAGKDDEYQ